MNGRNVLLDALKFLAIALVVLGHVLSLPRFQGVADPVYYALAAFEMPLFACLSGYVLFGREGDSQGRFLWKKSLALVIPYFAWIIVALLVRRSPLEAWPTRLAETAINPHVPGTLWFLYVLFIFYVLFVSIRLISKRDLALVVAAGLAALLFVLPDGDVLGRLNVQRLFPYFVAGYLYAEHPPKLGKRSRVLIAATSGLVFAGLVAFNYNGPTQNPRWYTMSLQEAVLTRPLPVTYLLGVASTYLLAAAGVAWAASCYSLLPRAVLEKQAVPGRSTLGIYAIHPSLLLATFGAGVLGAAASWAFVLLGAWVAALGLQRVPVARSLLLGKWNARTPRDGGPTPHLVSADPASGQAPPSGGAT